MELVKAKCTMCNGDLDVNPEAECLICKYCGSPFIVQKAINHYNTVINNNVVNNIKADTVIIQGKNIDSLIERGKELMNPKSVKDTNQSIKSYFNYKELRKIVDDIMEVDHKNFYARFFLIGCDDNSQENFDICENTTNEEEIKVFMNFLVHEINVELSHIEESFPSTKYTNFDNLMTSTWFTYLNSLDNINQKNELAKDYYKKAISKIESVIKNISNIIYNTLYHFDYSKFLRYRSYEQPYEVAEKQMYLVSLLAQRLDKFISYISTKYFDITSINDIFNQIFYVLVSNKKAVLESRFGWGDELLNVCCKLSGKRENIEILNEITKIILKGISAADKKIKLILYNDKIEAVISRNNILTINTKDVLAFSRCDKQNDNIIIVWYDLLWKLSDQTYSVLHFTCNKQKKETLSKLDIPTIIYKWKTMHSIKWQSLTYTSEKNNPFINGYENLSYEKTLSVITSGCYVATCVYGSYDCPEVWTLRRYRDNYLDNSKLGRLFIKVYYKVSPKIVKLFGKTKWFHKINKFILDKKVKKLINKGYENTKYNDKY